MKIYKDKNGDIIEDGMTIKHNDGQVKKIFSNSKHTDLGVLATKEHVWSPLIYPLYQFYLEEWVIVNED